MDKSEKHNLFDAALPSHLFIPCPLWVMARVTVPPWMPGKELQVVVMTANDTCNAALKVFSLTLLKMHDLSAPSDLLEATELKLGHQLLLPIGCRLFSGQIP